MNVLNIHPRRLFSVYPEFGATFTGYTESSGNITELGAERSFHHSSLSPAHCQLTFPRLRSHTPGLWRRARTWT